MAKKNSELYSKIQKLLTSEFKKYITDSDKPHDSFLFIGSSLKDGELEGGSIEAGNFGSARNISFLLVSASNENEKLQDAILGAAKIIQYKKIKAAKKKYEQEAIARGEPPCNTCGGYHPHSHDDDDESPLPARIRSIVDRLRQTITDLGESAAGMSPIVLSRTPDEIAQQLRNINNENNANRPNSEPDIAPRRRTTAEQITDAIRERRRRGGDSTGRRPDSREQFGGHETFEDFIRRTRLEREGNDSNLESEINRATEQFNELLQQHRENPNNVAPPTQEGEV